MSDEAPEISMAFAPQSREIVPRASAAMAVHGAAAIAIGTAARVEAEGKMLLARQYPREIELVEKRLLADCSRPSFARGARFARPVGGDCKACEGSKFADNAQRVPCRECMDRDGHPTGKNIARGLSVHFARNAFAAMGNIDVRTMLLYEDEEESIMRCQATDLETNAHMSFDVKVTKIIERRKLNRGQRALGTRANSYGDTVYLVRAEPADHEKDRAAAAAKKLRDAILALVPQDIKEACEAQIDATMTKALSADRKKTVAQLVAAYGQLKPPVTEEEIAAYLGHAVADLTDAEYLDMQAIFTGLREGACSWIEVMADKRGDLERDAEGKGLVEGLRKTLDKKKEEKAKKPDGAPPAPAKPEAAASSGDAPKPEAPKEEKPAEDAKSEPKKEESAAPENRCAGSGVRVKLNDTEQRDRRTRCPTCQRALGVRVAAGGEATIPPHIASTQTMMGSPTPPATEGAKEREPGAEG